MLLGGGGFQNWEFPRDAPGERGGGFYPLGSDSWGVLRLMKRDLLRGGGWEEGEWEWVLVIISGGDMWRGINESRVKKFGNVF